MTAPTLKIDWCTHEAASHSVERWHYSKQIPSGKLVKIGVWEDERFVGSVIFGRGANNHIGTPFGLTSTEVAELVRVALRDHVSPVSRIVSIALRMFRRQSPGIRLIVSYADPEQGHHGGIYQALGWVYSGPSTAQSKVVINGREMHKRSASARWGTASVQRLSEKGIDVKRGPVRWKHTYLLPLDDEMRVQIAPLAKSYPKRAESPRAGNGSPAGTPGGEGGAKPTPALQGKLK